ncbi:lipase [Gordonia crocea]|uniref:Lipase n=1 Tax=Gordonia crocea TaxID=589162 RepID=A0A7I9V1H3_9ACTN|nr:lipase [Gordonia crocea]
MALAAVLVAADATAFAEPPTPAAPAPAPAPAKPHLPTGAPYTHGTYVAMGDSRAAGGSATLTVDYQLNPCRRSGDNYPSMVRDRIRPRQFTDISCIGAESAHLRHYPQVMGMNAGSVGSGSASFTIAPQLGQVPPTTQVITVSTGGNDLGWAEMLKKCNFRQHPNCRRNPSQQARLARGLHRLTIQSTTTMRAIRARAPQAQIFTVGLGGFIGSHGCHQVQLRNGDAKWFREVFAKANDRLRKATEAVGGKFIDIADPGHDACSGRPWFYGRHAPAGNMAFHLNTVGRAVLANRIAASIRR